MSTYTLDLAKLRSACKFSMTYDDKSGSVILNGSCTLKGSDGKSKTFKRKIDLTPMVRELQARLHDHRGHAGFPTLPSGDLTISHAGGWLSDTYHQVVTTAKTIGENRIVRDIYDDVLPEVAPFIPGGSAALSIANKAHAVLNMARGGHPGALAKIAHLKEAALSSPAAHEALTMMQHMNRLLKMKEGYADDQVSGWAFNKPYRDPITAATSFSPGQAMRFLYNEGMGR